MSCGPAMSSARSLRLETLEIGSHAVDLGFEHRIRTTAKHEIPAKTANGELGVASEHREPSLLAQQRRVVGRRSAQVLRTLKGRERTGKIARGLPRAAGNEVADRPELALRLAAEHRIEANEHGPEIGATRQSRQLG